MVADECQRRESLLAITQDACDGNESVQLVESSLGANAARPFTDDASAFRIRLLKQNEFSSKYGLAPAI